MKTRKEAEGNKPARTLRHVAVYFPSRAYGDTAHRWQLPRLVVPVKNAPAEPERVMLLEAEEEEER